MRKNWLNCVLCVCGMLFATPVLAGGDHSPSGWQWGLIALPTILFLCFFIFLLSIKDRFIELFLEKRPSPRARRTYGPHKEPPSALSFSRFCGMVAIMGIIITVFVYLTYGFYHFCCNGSWIPVEPFINLILCLTVGLIPYALNRLSAAFTENEIPDGRRE